MQKADFKLNDGGTFHARVDHDAAGNEYLLTGYHVAGETTVTCTCSGGKSVTKKCPSDQGNTCDCSNPQHPKITCG